MKSPARCPQLMGNKLHYHRSSVTWKSFKSNLLTSPGSQGKVESCLGLCKTGLGNVTER